MTGACVARCRVVRDTGARLPGRVVDDHVVAVAGPGADRRWMLAADVVHVPVGARLTPERVLDELPGCLVVADLRGNPVIRIRGVRGVLGVPGPELAWVAGSVAHTWMVERGGVGPLAEYLASAELTSGVRGEGSPVSSASVLCAGRRSLFVWTTRG